MVAVYKNGDQRLSLINNVAPGNMVLMWSVFLNYLAERLKNVPPISSKVVFKMYVLDLFI